MVSKFIPSSVSTVSTNPYQLHIDIYLHIYLYISIYPYLHPQLQLIENLRHKGFLKDCPDGLLTEAGFIKIYTQVVTSQSVKNLD